MAGSALSAEDGFVLVVDVGSSSARCWLFDAAAVALAPGAPARVRYGWEVGEGRMETCAETMLGHVVEVVDGALATVRERKLQVAAVAVTTFWHSLVGMDTGRRAATPLTGWGDARAAGTALRLAERVDGVALHRRTGCFLHPSYPLVRLAWLRSDHPRPAAGVSVWGSFAEFMETRFFGTPRCSHSMASGSGLLDVHRLEWDEEALELAGVAPERLSPLVEANEPRSGLTLEFAARWPELAAVPWFPALGDGACANLGSGAVGGDRLGITIGTTAAVRLLLHTPSGLEVPPDLWAYRLDRARWVVGGAISNGGAILPFLRRTLGLEDGDGWDELLRRTEPDGHGITVLPYLLAERGPGELGEPGATVLGLRLDTDRAQLVRAWMEAVAYRIAGVCHALDRAFGPARTAAGSGGGLHGSREWAQMLADLLDRPLVLPEAVEETSRGAAIVAWNSLGVTSAAHGEPPVRERLEPDPHRHAVYARAMRRHRRLEAQMDHIFAGGSGESGESTIEPDWR